MLGEYLIIGRRASEIAASVEAGVASGALAPGALLPPMRELAGVLGVNPNTVAAAYRTLRERGVIETDGRRGSRVRARPATAPRDQLRMAVPAGVRDLVSGNPDVRLLPALDAALAGAARRYAAQPTLYGQDPVVPELARLARAAFDADGVPTGEVAVTSGALDGVERVLAAHLRPGTRWRSRTRGGGACSTSSRRWGYGWCPWPWTTTGRCPTRWNGRWRRGSGRCS